VRAGRLPREQIQEMLQTPPPRGIAVLIAKNANHNDPRRKPAQCNFVCDNVPTHEACSYEPHGIDTLILLEMKGISNKDIATCLGLQNVENDDGNARVWKNLDGTTLATHAHCSETGRGRVCLSSGVVMPCPNHIGFCNAASPSHPTKHVCSPGEDGRLLGPA
jgi:hypothetical protein